MWMWIKAQSPTNPSGHDFWHLVHRVSEDLFCVYLTRQAHKCLIYRKFSKYSEQTIQK